jgi:hypothetical protein
MYKARYLAVCVLYLAVRRKGMVSINLQTNAGEIGVNVTDY